MSDFEKSDAVDQYLDQTTKKGKPSKLKFGKGSSMEDEMGSKDQPCDPDDAKPRRDLGKKQFDPYNTGRSTEDWECNTKIEDKLLNALQTYIAGNSTKPVQGPVGEFILDHFKDKTDPNLPLEPVNNIFLY